MNRFDILNDLIRNTENSFVNFLSAFAPWLAPLVPSYMTWEHAVGVLGFPVLIALAAALVVEILGFTAVSTYLSFWFYNRKKVAESKRAPTGIVIVAFSFYLVLIVFSNVLLDTFPGQAWAEIAVRALFTFQTIPAAMLVAVRTQHRELLSEIAKERAERKEKVSEGSQKEDSEVSETFRNFPRDWRQLEPTLTYEQTVNLANLSSVGVREWANKIGVSERTITNWRDSAKAKLEKMKNE